MATYENKSMNRQYNPNTGEDIYTTERGIKYDLSEMRFLHAGIDTIRQLYICNLKLDVLALIDEHLKQDDTNIITLGGHQWKFSTSGKASGYQYNFKNLELGFVVLMKHFYTQSDSRGPHIKIEVSPHVIITLGLEKLTKKLREIGSIFAKTLEASGVAVHMAVDMKGLDQTHVLDGFEENLHTRSRRSFKVNGISDASFSTAEAAFIYGRSETFLFGKSSGLQLCLYNKTLEANKSGKLNFWESIWSLTPKLETNNDATFFSTGVLEDEYNDGTDGTEPDTVHRLEFRIHHSVIKQFETGNFELTGNLVCIREPVDLKLHLNELWRYCLNNFRLSHSSTYEHPAWTKLRDDIWFADMEHPEFLYKRGYGQKKLTGTEHRNVAMYLGNYLKLCAYNNVPPLTVLKHLKAPNIRRSVRRYFESKTGDELDDVDFQKQLQDFIWKRLQEHRLNGVAA